MRMLLTNAEVQLFELIVIRTGSNYRYFLSGDESLFSSSRNLFPSFGVSKALGIQVVFLRPVTQFACVEKYRDL
jgi:hypothetical protein